jgi:hypothetical protein
MPSLFRKRASDARAKLVLPLRQGFRESSGTMTLPCQPKVAKETVGPSLPLTLFHRPALAASVVPRPKLGGFPGDPFWQDLPFSENRLGWAERRVEMGRGTWSNVRFNDELCSNGNSAPDSGSDRPGAARWELGRWELGRWGLKPSDNCSTIRIYCCDMSRASESSDALASTHPWARPGCYFRMSAEELRPTNRHTEPVGRIAISWSRRWALHIWKSAAIACHQGVRY